MESFPWPGKGYLRVPSAVFPGVNPRVYVCKLACFCTRLRLLRVARFARCDFSHKIKSQNASFVTFSREATSMPPCTRVTTPENSPDCALTVTFRPDTSANFARISRVCAAALWRARSCKNGTLGSSGRISCDPAIISLPACGMPRHSDP